MDEVFTVTGGLAYPWAMSRGSLGRIMMSWPLARLEADRDQLTLTPTAPISGLFPAFSFRQSDVVRLERIRGGIRVVARLMERDPPVFLAFDVEATLDALELLGYPVDREVHARRLQWPMPRRHLYYLLWILLGGAVFMTLGFLGAGNVALALVVAVYILVGIPYTVPLIRLMKNFGGKTLGPSAFANEFRW